MSIDFLKMFERALTGQNTTEITFIYRFLQIFITLLKVMESNLLNIVYFFSHNGSILFFIIKIQNNYGEFKYEK